jgi:ABC-type branched-subunit amino acid transport system substrate-binding protein
VSEASVGVGVLYDFPQHDGGEFFETALRLGIASSPVELKATVHLQPLQVAGLPAGTERDVIDGFKQLDDSDVVAIVGPSISDNGVIVRDLADSAQLPCINYTGGEVTRSQWMFHYQVGSLEEEPVVLAQHLAERGLATVAVLYDDSVVGSRYSAAFSRAAAENGLAVLASASVSPLAEDLSEAIKDVREHEPAAVCYLGLGMAARPVAVAIKEHGWSVPVVANSALMFGYLRKDWRADWEGWVYVDTLADDNPVRVELKERDRRTAAGSVGVAGYDIGRLLGLAIGRLGSPTRAELRDGLEQIKRLPAASGHAGTVMGFGWWDHAALKGPYLVLREWRDGRSVQLTA